MALGARGVVSVASNLIPEVMASMTHLCLEGRFEEAARLQLAHTALFDALFSGGQSHSDQDRHGDGRLSHGRAPAPAL